MSSYKTVLRAILFLVCAYSLAACDDAARTESAFSNNREEVLSDVREPIEDDQQALDLGQNWYAESAPAPVRGAPGSGAPRSSVSRGAAPAVGTGAAAGSRSVSAPSGRRSSFWTILLGTYTAQGHESAAANMSRSCSAIDPTLGHAYVHTTSKGSMVVYGRYEDPQDAAAKRDLEWVKGIAIQGRPVFPRAMLTRVVVRQAHGPFRLNELLSVRGQFPKVDPLYTLQVAVWGDFDSGKLTLEEIRRSAEAYTAELRSRGHDAYFHHDDDQRLSMVTVGLFDNSALDPESGLYAPEVELLMRRFPEHLVNGEQILEPISRRTPDKTQVQRPKLVLVPML